MAMKRMWRQAPLVLALVGAACQQVPVLNAATPGQGVVVQGPQEGGWAIRLDLAPAAAAPGFGLLAESGSTDAVPVHRWVAADLVRYDVELRVRNATTATQFDAVGAGLSAQVPVNGQGAGSATFTKLRPGAYYRAYVKAMGRKGGNAGADAIVQLNSQATSDYADFDFTGNNDVAQQASGQVTVRLDGVAFSGQGGLAFGSPLPGGYASPTGALGIQPILPPSPSPSATPRPLQSLVASYTVGSFPQGVAVDAQGNLWVANSDSNSVTKLASSGSVLGTFGGIAQPVKVAIDAEGAAWVLSVGFDYFSPPVPPALVKLASSGQFLGSFSVGDDRPTALAIDPRGGAIWVATSGGQSVMKLASTGNLLGSHLVAGDPSALAIDAQGQVWVGQGSSNAHVNLLASTGSLLGTFAAGEAVYGIAIDRLGQVWVASGDRDRVFQLASSGSLIASHPVAGYPFALDVDGEGRVWVGTLSGSLTVMSSQGSVLATHALGEVWGIAVSSTGQVWASRSSANSVALFS